MSVDLLAVGAHSDDVELGIGGTIHKLTRHGWKVVILDLTQAEMSTRGTPASRCEEAKRAAAALGVERRENAGLPDAGLVNTPEQRNTIIPFVREFQPKVVVTLMQNDRHPDHHAAMQLVYDACFLAGLKKIDTGQNPYRPKTFYYFHPYTEGEKAPSMIVDISEDFEAKLTALKCYESQFHNPDYSGDETYIASRDFWDGIETRARHWGRQIGVRFGEPLHSHGPVGVAFPPGLGEPS